MYEMRLENEPSQASFRAQVLNHDTYFHPVEGGPANSDIKKNHKAVKTKSVLHASNERSMESKKKVQKQTRKSKNLVYDEEGFSN